MNGLARWGRLRRAVRTGSAEDLGQILRRPRRERLAAGGEHLSTPAATTNDRNGEQGATSEVGRLPPVAKVRFYEDSNVKASFYRGINLLELMVDLEL